MMPVESKASSE
jgi:predicted nucleic acid-binding protein